MLRNEDKTLIIHVILSRNSLLLLVELLLARLLITLLLTEIFDLCLNLSVTLLQLNFEDINDLLALQRGSILALQHGLSREFSLSNVRNLSHWNNDWRLHWATAESSFIFVDKEGVGIEDKVSFHKVVMLVDQLVKITFVNYSALLYILLIFFMHVELELVFLRDLVIGSRAIENPRIDRVQVVAVRRRSLFLSCILIVWSSSIRIKRLLLRIYLLILFLIAISWHR